MRLWGKALLVPVVALAIWVLPSDDPTAESVAGISALADPPSVDDQNETPSVTSGQSTTSSSFVGVFESPTTTAAASTTTTQEALGTIDAAAEVSNAPVVEGEVDSTTTTAEPLSMGDQALLRVAYPWRERFPEWRVFFRGPRDGIRALTFPAERRIEIFIRSSDTVSSLHRVFAHELGHLVDVELNSDADRDRWREQRSISSDTPWWPSASAPDFATGAGDFAEAFAVWETGVTTRSTVGTQPTSADIELLIELSGL